MCHVTKISYCNGIKRIVNTHIGARCEDSLVMVGLPPVHCSQGKDTTVCQVSVTVSQIERSSGYLKYTMLALKHHSHGKAAITQPVQS